MNKEQIIAQIKEDVAEAAGYTNEVFVSRWQYAMMLTHRTKQQLVLYERVIDVVCSNSQKNELVIPDVVLQSEQLPPPQICYKTNEPCKHDCKGLCKESC